MFYTAVHLIRSFLSRKSADYRSEYFHYDDFETALEDLEEPQIATNFEQLKDFSQRARYDCKGEAWCSAKLPAAGLALVNIKNRIVTLQRQMDAENVPPDGP